LPKPFVCRYYRIWTTSKWELISFILILEFCRFSWGLLNTPSRFCSFLYFWDINNQKKKMRKKTVFWDFFQGRREFTIKSHFVVWLQFCQLQSQFFNCLFECHFFPPVECFFISNARPLPSKAGQFLVHVCNSLVDDVRDNGVCGLLQSRAPGPELFQKGQGRLLLRVEKFRAVREAVGRETPKPYLNSWSHNQVGYFHGLWEDPSFNEGWCYKMGIRKNHTLRLQW